MPRIEALLLVPVLAAPLGGCGRNGTAWSGEPPRQAGDSVPLPGSQNFATRCAQPGVIRCVGFDAASDIAGTWGSNTGILPGKTAPRLDSAIKVSGASSLKFTIPSNSGSDSSGSYFANFSTDLMTQFGENQEFYIQWRQRFSPELINTVYQNGDGWKQVIIGAGDKPGCTPSNNSNGLCQSSCTALETVVQNSYQRKFPQMYNSCTGSSSHGAYDPFEQRFGNSDFKLQNARPSPYCLFSQSGARHFPPAGNCFGYFADEWMTFQIRIKTGPRANSGAGNEWGNSFVTLWMGRENRASERVINWGPYALSADVANKDLRFGKIWLLPYHTHKNPAQSHPTAYTWYDELIISRSQIADPAP